MTRAARIHSRSVLAVLLTIMVVLVFVVAILAGRQLSIFGNDAPSLSPADGQSAYTYDFVIEPGTADRIAADEVVDVVPQNLTVRVGESIRIVNDDSVNHTVGVFYVPAGRTLTQHFNSPGVLEGTCDVHPSGRFKLTVVE